MNRQTDPEPVSPFGLATEQRVDEDSPSPLVCWGGCWRDGFAEHCRASALP